MVVAALLQRFGAEHLPLLKQPPAFAEYALLAYLALPVWLSLIVVTRLHLTFEHPLSQAELLTKLMKLHIVGLTVLALIQFLLQSVVNRSLVALFLLASFLLMYAQRTVAYAWTRYQHESGQGRPTLLLVGQPSRRMHDFVRDAMRSRLNPLVLGYLRGSEPTDGLSLPPSDAPPLPQLGDLAALQQLLEERSVTEVLFFAPYQRPDRVQTELALCEELGVSASFVVDVRQLSRAAPRITELYDHCVISYDIAPKRPEALALKHGLDPLLAALLILLTAPIMLAIALAIAIDMGRPVLFGQSRAGIYGRPFRMLKFRTMRNGAEAEQAALLASNEMAGPVFKARNDPRVTRLGRLLRRMSLDELPQLFNVLTGSMSLVGPRPLPVQEQRQIRGWQRRRLSMKPGITCLWQTSGRSDVDFENWMLLDLKYVDEWSLWLDVQILLRTVPAVLRGRGAR
jgi:exopolysaccharide biosynthesis polyprenyl glycosylphosphotransferase